MENNILVKLKFGSHLYGTNTPTSDTDYKGVYLPSKREVIIGKFSKCLSFNTKAAGNTNKNSKNDIDYEVYSLHYFLELALQGETMAIDMIHAPEDMLIINSSIWHELVSNRSKLYTKNLKAFVGYARTQAAKYGIKGSRLNQAKMVIDFLNGFPVHTRINEVWDNLPTGEHLSKMVDIKGVPMYVVCGKKMQGTATIKNVLPSLDKYYHEYGQRAQLAADNQGIDWKAISHAMRAAFQVREILTTGDLKFPLKNADYLLKVKQGLLDYKTEVGPRLEKEMDELEVIARDSKLPDKPDTLFWEDFIFNIYR